MHCARAPVRQGPGDEPCDDAVNDDVDDVLHDPAPADPGLDLVDRRDRLARHRAALIPARHAPLRRYAVLVLTLLLAGRMLSGRACLVGDPALSGRAALARHGALAGCTALPLLAWRVGLLTGFPGLA